MSATLVWLRDDLRLDDNPALAEAAALGTPLTVVYVLDEESPGVRPLGGAVKWWLHHSLAGLAAALEATGSRLVLRRGPAARIIQDLAVETSADTLLWNRRYGGPERAVDAGLKSWAAGGGHQRHELPGKPHVRAMDRADRQRGPLQGLHAVLEGLPGRHRAPAAAGGPGPAAGPGTHPQRRPAGERNARRLGPAPP